MSMHSSMSHKSIIKRIKRDQTSHPLSLRQELNAAYTAAMMVARGYRTSRNPKDVAKREQAGRQMADLAEQLRLLTAIENGEITPILEGGAIQLAQPEYPPALLAARRARFVAQIEAMNCDPDACDIQTPPVSDEQDARNSRHYPY